MRGSLRFSPNRRQRGTGAFHVLLVMATADADRRTLYCFGEMPTDNEEALSLEIANLTDHYVSMTAKSAPKGVKPIEGVNVYKLR
jgi:hypothetical protein